MIIVISFLTISSLVSALVPVLSSVIINNLITNRNIPFLILSFMLIFFLDLLGYVFNYINWNYSTRAIGSVLLDLRKDVTTAVMNHDLSFFDKNPTGKIVSRINSDSSDFGQTVDLTNQVVSSVFTVVILLIFMVIMNIMLALIFLLTIPLFFAISLYLRKLARRKTLLGQRALASVNEIVKETLVGIQIAKTFRQEEKIFKQFNDVNEQSYRVNLRRAWVLNIIFPSLGLVQGIVLTLLIYYGGLFIMNGQINAGDLYLFFQSLWLMFFPLFIIASFWPQFQSGLAASERIFSLIDTIPVVIQNNNIKPHKLKGKIEFRNLTFQYEDDKKVFDNFSLTVQPGESIALVGHTGAGKSSIAKLIARFYEFQEGDILVDDISIRNFNLTEYRKQIGINSQTPFLWADTVENNIKYCCELAKREDVIKALDQTGGSDWIEELPKGLDTYIRERGSLLSMGQRQLVTFARVLLQDPSILILDEATASIDPFTETRIQDALAQTIQNRTSIIIAHRLWTVRHVDRIVVLDHGKIIEEGNHEQLMAKGGTYARLYNTYFRHQSLEYIEKVKR